MLKKVYAKITALRRLKHIVPANTLLVLYRSFVLPHFEYCNSLFIGQSKTINKKLENANYYGLRTVTNMNKSKNYESIVRMADMRTLEHRRIEQSLNIFFNVLKKMDQATLPIFYIANYTPYNLRNSKHVVQDSYKS